MHFLQLLLHLIIMPAPSAVFPDSIIMLICNLDSRANLLKTSSPYLKIPKSSPSNPFVRAKFIHKILTPFKNCKKTNCFSLAHQSQNII